MKTIALSLICLLGLSACSTTDVDNDEQMLGYGTPITKALKVQDLLKSDCKKSLSATDTRPEIYDEYMNKPAILSMNLDADGVAKCQITDVLANCAVEGINVKAIGKDRSITLVVYPSGDASLAADCMCDYDVDFKIDKLSPGKFDLKVYRADYSGNYSKSAPVFDGTINLDFKENTQLNLHSLAF